MYCVGMSRQYKRENHENLRTNQISGQQEVIPHSGQSLPAKAPAGNRRRFGRREGNGPEPGSL